MVTNILTLYFGRVQYSMNLLHRQLRANRTRKYLDWLSVDL